MKDKEYMQIAIDISTKAKYPYGAIVVKDNKIIGRSDSKRVKIDTCYTHAEFVAIQDALKENNLGLMCPGYTNQNSKLMNVGEEITYVKSMDLITSGMLHNVNVFETVGYY